MNTLLGSRVAGVATPHPDLDTDVVPVGRPLPAAGESPTATIAHHDTKVQLAHAACPPAGPTRSAARDLAARAGRAARRVTAFTFLLCALWFWAVPFFLPVTSRAVVNARLVQVRAPVGGEVVALPVGVGDAVVAGSPVLRVAAKEIDVSQLSTLRARHAEAFARRVRLARELAATTSAEAACRADLERYRRVVVETLRAGQKEGEARVVMAEAQSRGADRRLGLKQDLVVRQVAGATEEDDDRDAAAVARARIDLERAALGRVAREAEAADQGLFVTREMPVFETQARELALRIPRLAAEVREADHLLADAARAVGEEEERVRRLTDAVVPAPVSGVVWKRAGNPTQLVDRNESVVDIADRATVVVEALLHQRYAATVGPGDRAVVHLTGGPTLTGQVRAVRTSNADEADPGYALSLTDRDVKQLKVVIALDPPGVDAGMIGRHARVLVTGADPGPVGRGVEWLFTRVRY